MTASLESSTADPVSRSDSATARRADRLADRASRRVWRVGAALGFLGLLSFAVVFLRLAEHWRVAPSASHHITIFGQTLSYPAANAAAVLIVGLAGVGAFVTVIALRAIAREFFAARAVARRLAALHPSRQDGVWVLDDDHPAAFCAGLLRPRVYITTGAVAALERPGLDAVLLHERHHASRRDPLRSAVARVIERSLFFLPSLDHLREGQQLLAELGADERAVDGLAGDPSALAQAMLTFTDGGDSAPTHPLTDPEPGGVDPARIDALLGEPPSWRFPTLLCLVAVTLLAVIVTSAILVGREAAGTATLAPPFLSAQPCIVMLALAPAVFVLVAARLMRSQQRRWGRTAPR